MIKQLEKKCLFVRFMEDLHEKLTQITLLEKQFLKW